jgi:hypothetical protein
MMTPPRVTNESANHADRKNLIGPEPRCGSAAEYALDLPGEISSTQPWQRAADALRKAAEHGGPFVFIARISFDKPVFGEDDPPVGNPEGK